VKDNISHQRLINLSVLNILLTKIVLFLMRINFIPLTSIFFFLRFAMLFVTFLKSYLLFCATNAVFLHYSCSDSELLSAGLSIEHR
jgi:hypothetical protein